MVRNNVYYYVVVCVADSLCYETQNILSTYPVALSELLFNLLTDRLVPVHREEDKGTLAALTPPALAVAVALLPKVNPPGGGGTGGRLGGPKVEGSGGGPAAAATGAGAGAAGGAGAGCAAAAAPMTPSSLRPVPVLTVEEASLSTLMPYLDAMSPAVCMSLGTSMEFGWDEIDPSGCQFGVRLRCYCNTNVLTVVVVV
jgi:hypothetical protein